jgi:uncharacterized protein (TIGR03435 family)
MIRLLGLFLLAVAVSAGAQQPTFSVATIKPSSPDAPTMTQIQGKRFVTSGTTFVDLFKYAFSVHDSQVIGEPKWLRTERFDVVADPGGEQRPTSEQMKALVRQLLLDRFHVVLRRDTRELSVYALQKTGAAPRLTASAADANAMPSGGGEAGEIGMNNGTMANFAAYLQRFAGPSVNRPVVDQTGIAGRFDLDLRFAPDVEAESNPNTPGLFTAIQEQLGLRLKATKAPVDVYIVQSATRPAVDS